MAERYQNSLLSTGLPLIIHSLSCVSPLSIEPQTATLYNLDLISAESQTEEKRRGWQKCKRSQWMVGQTPHCRGTGEIIICGGRQERRISYKGIIANLSRAIFNWPLLKLRGTWREETRERQSVKAGAGKARITRPLPPEPADTWP